MPSHAPTRFLERTSPPHIGTLIALSGVSALAMNVFLPSLPGMAEYFGTTGAVMGLSVGLYLFVNALLQIVIGPVSDKFGRRRVILVAMVIYILATVGCLMAPTATIFLSFRMLQASIAVAMVLSRAVVRDTTAADAAGAKIAYVTMGMSLVPMVAPAIGGFLEQSFGWHANFLLLLAAGVAVFAIAWFDLGETAQPSEMTLGRQFAEMPELLKSPRFWGYSLASTCSAGAFFSFLGGVPFVAVNVFALEPQELGLYFAAPSLGYFFGNFLAGRYSARLGINRMILIGLLATCIPAALSLWLSLTGAQTLGTFFTLMVPVGLGNGMTIPNGLSGALSVRPQLAGTASGLSGALMLAGGAALSAIAGLALKNGTSAAPLALMMALSALAGVIAILLVMRREKRLGGLA